MIMKALLLSVVPLVLLVPCANADSWTLQREPSGGICHVLQALKSGLKSLGTFPTQKDACQKAKAVFERSLDDPGNINKCTGFDPGSISVCKTWVNLS
jgi:hypothetical protein